MLSRLPIAERKVYLERAADAHVTVSAYGAMMGLYDPAGDGEPESGTAALVLSGAIHSVEALENVTQICLWDADACI